MEDLEYRKYMLSIYNIIKEKDVTLANTLFVAYSLACQTRSGIYIPGNPDLMVPRAKDRYDSVIKYIDGKNPREYFISDFSSQKMEDNLEYVYYIACSILGESDELFEIFKDFVDNLCINDSKSILDGYCYKTIDPNKPSQYMIEIPSETSISSIACALHEFIHFYLLKHNIAFPKAYYEEILSILFEKIAADFVEQDLKEKDYIRKIESSRLDCIRYHNVNKKEELEAMRLFLQLVRQYSKNWQEHEQRMLLDYEAYHDKLAHSYGLGYIYAENLFLLYKNDKKTFIEVMKKIFSGEVTLQEALDDFNITTANKVVFDNAKIKIKEVTKK